MLRYHIDNITYRINVKWKTKIFTEFMIKRILCTALVVLAVSLSAMSQNVALKTNALYWATTTPNIGIEASVGKKSTLQLFYGLNPWKQSGGDQSSLRHWLLMPEYRYWFCESFNGWFIGAHLMGEAVRKLN